jgi:DNA-binding transcriptional MerR regulator
MKQGRFISELSRQVDIPVPTIRYYERLGLLDPPQRTASQYRIYSEEAEERLQFIQQAKRFGLSLNDIKQILDLSAKGVTPCRSVKNMMEQRLNEVDRRIQEMVEFRQKLTHRYMYLDNLLPDSASAINPAIHGGKICGFIEQEID